MTKLFKACLLATALPISGCAMLAGTAPQPPETHRQLPQTLPDETKTSLVSPTVREGDERPQPNRPQSSRRLLP
jgi:hypothetical protein